MKYLFSLLSIVILYLWYSFSLFFCYFSFLISSFFFCLFVFFCFLFVCFLFFFFFFFFCGWGLSFISLFSFSLPFVFIFLPLHCLIHLFVNSLSTFLFLFFSRLSLSIIFFLFAYITFFSPQFVQFSSLYFPLSFSIVHFLPHFVLCLTPFVFLDLAVNFLFLYFYSHSQ